MESWVAKLLSANYGHKCFSSSELQLLTDYFCEPAEATDSSEDASDSDKDVAVDTDSTSCAPTADKESTSLPEVTTDDELCLEDVAISDTGDFNLPCTKKKTEVLDSTSYAPTAVIESTSLPEVTSDDELCSEIRAFRCQCKLSLKGRPCIDNLNETLILQQKLSCFELDYYLIPETALTGRPKGANQVVSYLHDCVVRGKSKSSKNNWQRAGRQK